MHKISIKEIFFKKGDSNKVLLAFFVLFGLSIILNLFFPSFLRFSNIIGILRQAAFLVIAGLGFTFIFASGSFDLSVGAVASTSGLIVALLMASGYSLVFAITIGLLFGLISGLINALFVVKIGMPTIIGTLSTMLLLTGLQFLVTGGGMPIYMLGNKYKNFLLLAKGKICKIPIPIVVAIFLIILAYLLLHKHKYGFRLYSIGGNEEAALIQGIPINKYKTIAFILGSFFASICGIFVASYSSSATVQGADQYLMLVIIAVYIGTVLSEEKQVNIIGTVYGSIFVVLLTNILALLNVPYYGEFLFKGLLLMGVVLLSKRELKIVS